MVIIYWMKNYVKIFQFMTLHAKLYAVQNIYTCGCVIFDGYIREYNKIENM